MATAKRLLKRHSSAKVRDMHDRLAALRDQFRAMELNRLKDSPPLDPIEARKAKLQAELDMLNKAPNTINDLHHVVDKSRTHPETEAWIYSFALWYEHHREHLKEHAPTLYSFLMSEETYKATPEALRALSTHFLVLADLVEWKKTKDATKQPQSDLKI